MAGIKLDNVSDSEGTAFAGHPGGKREVKSRKPLWSSLDWTEKESFLLLHNFRRKKEMSGA